MTLAHKGTVLLETERLILRRFELEDAQLMYKNWAGDCEVSKFMTWQTHQSIKASRVYLTNLVVPEYENRDYYQWAIVLKSLGEPIGSMGVVHSDYNIKMVEVGYCIGKQWWHQGYTSEALSTVIQFLFEAVGINRIVALHDINNPNSGKVMQKCGLLYEGTLRQSVLNKEGELRDMAHYAILAQDFLG